MPSYKNFNSEKKICQSCGIEKSEKHYYLTPSGTRLEICKDCFSNEFYNSKDLFQVFKKYDIPYFYDVWDRTVENIGDYMRQINSLPQYKYKTWKDSILSKEEDESENTIGFYDEIIKNLKEEAKKLNQKLLIATNRDDMQLYISAIKSLRETLDLIHKYDWQLMYSAYETCTEEGRDSKTEKQVAVWRQNYDGLITNHRIWRVIEEISSPNKIG
jgi:hypothetical protein